jgi:hypothetical protein
MDTPPRSSLGTFILEAERGTPMTGEHDNGWNVWWVVANTAFTAAGAVTGIAALVIVLIK